MIILRAVTVKSRVTPNLRSQLVSEVQRAVREIDLEIVRAAGEGEHSQLVAKKDDLVRELKEIAELKDGTEVVRGQVQGCWDLRVGDVWPEVLSSEIVVEDGRVVAVREGRTVSR